jgi:endonuclease/exonuclease/phosphatase family metal-dependent hydrolase
MGEMKKELSRREDLRRAYRRLIRQVRGRRLSPGPGGGELKAIGMNLLRLTGEKLDDVTRLVRGRRRRPSAGGHEFKIISWNLLRLTGATLDDVVRLVRAQRPDLLLMQEATRPIDSLTEHVGGYYWRTPQPGRIHGLAVWSRRPLAHPPKVLALPAGSMFERVCLIVELDGIGIANVHLSHGQVLNRRQLRRIAKALPERAAVLGDYNLVGPTLLPGFDDVGPRRPTHVMGELVPLRIDRCLVRELDCIFSAVLPRRRSDHHPIAVKLAVAPSSALAVAA